MPYFRKGTRVKWVAEDNREHHGTVIKGGSKVVVAVEDGGRRQATGPADIFYPSVKRLPEHPASTMDRYTVKNFRVIPGGQETRRIEGTILEDGTPIASFDNAGRGGANLYQPLVDRQALDTLELFARDWCALNGLETPIDPIDLWLDWEVDGKPYGELALDYCKAINDSLKGVSGG
jgi:hypothetical protein